MHPISNTHPLLLLLLSLFFSPINSYIDIELAITTSSADIVLNMPVSINNIQYYLAVSLQNKEEYVVAPYAMPHHKRTSKKNKNGEKMQAVMHVWSLQGYTLQGWKRFFLEVFLFQNSKYSHTISFDLSSLKTLNKTNVLTNGLMTIGPQLDKNQIYNMIKSQTKDNFISDIVSFYSVPGGKDIRMQLGGFQDENARGYNNGIRYYQVPVGVNQGQTHWVLPINKMVIAKEKSNKWECFSIPFSGMRAKISIESQFVILPQTLKEDLQTSFQSQNIECSFSQTTSQLQCSNMSSIDQALTFLSLEMDKQVFINISLYDLRDQYNTKQKVTSFFIKLGKPSEVQIGAPMLKGHYISLNMNQKTMLFSPVNRFTPQISTAQIIRFIVMFMTFMIMACSCIVIWQQWNMPKNVRHRFARNKDGVRLVAYQKPAEFDDQDQE